jgi:hypothetical protein
MLGSSVKFLIVLFSFVTPLTKTQCAINCGKGDSTKNNVSNPGVLLGSLAKLRKYMLDTLCWVR